MVRTIVGTSARAVRPVSVTIIGGGMLLSATMPADAASCSASAINPRFVEAARLCGDAADGAVTPAPIAGTTSPVEPMTTALPAAFQHPASVSVSMPGYRTRLAIAARTVRAGNAHPSDGLIVAVGQRYRIDPHLLASMVRAESNGRAGAVSNKGALGLMQVMPATARGLGVRDPNAMLSDPVLALTTGAAYLKKLQGQLGNNVPLVVAAYNAGPGAVMKAGGRVPRYRETQGYVAKVMGRYVTARGEAR